MTQAPNSRRIVSAISLVTIALLLVAIDCISAEEPRFESLVPGVRITRLPIDITNIDSLDYGPDGKLYAAGYDGRVHVLIDSDGDGVEDKAKVFWEKPGDLLTPVGILPTDEGVYVAARGKIALLKDTDGDGAADLSETVVTGWEKEDHNSDTRNDAAGLAIDSTGNLYFSLGCMSYNKAWQLDGKGKSQYDIKSERGTILKVSPDRKRRDVIATGMRFVIGMEFNKHGDLFATDQEGDTWFPGGNPRDELLHVIPGRHYGFPFRHAKHLPDIVDEPEVVGFSPQHQSTCGFRFNEQRANRKPFGPKFWEGNAIVTGFSRGKLWRVPLAKTGESYVGKQIQFAAFESLPTDVAISPTGDLAVTCHSGKPDWGAGPAAKGHLYKITFDHDAPQPVIAWPASPLEVKIAFDRPIDPQRIDSAVITAGKFVWEGDDQEWIWPGYEVVKAAKAAVRYPLKVHGVQLSDDRRTLSLTTAAQPWRARYGIKLKGIAAVKNDSKAESAELSYDMGGVIAEWTRKGAEKPEWSGWLPHLDTEVVRSLTDGSAEHERLYQLLQTPGTLTMRANLLLPGEKVNLHVESGGEFAIECGEQSHKSKFDRMHVAKVSLSGSRDSIDTDQQHDQPRGEREQVLPTEEVPIKITTSTGWQQNLTIRFSYQADFDPHVRPLRLEHLFVPWSPSHVPPASPHEEGDSLQELVGDPEKGKVVFFGEKANCASCHKYAGKGGDIAADLTVSAQRDPAAVLRDIVDPNAAMNPDYVSYVVETIDGLTLTGLLQSVEEKSITLVDAKTKSHTIPREQIDEIYASPTSLMPTGFDQLGKDDLQNLVAFLCSEDADLKSKGLPTGVISRDYWLEVPDGDVKSLTSLKSFPNEPNGSGLLTRFEGPVNWKESYGTRIHGFIHPPKTGEYRFQVAADDYAELWLSTSDLPEDKVRIVDMRRWVPSRQWSKYPEQQSKPIKLEAGNRYYIEALQVEGSVDDCIAVGWTLPDGTNEQPIPGKRLSSANGLKE